MKEISSFSMKSLALVVCFIVFCISCENKARMDFFAYNELSTGFENPQGTARAKVYWWWINGYIDTVNIKKELQAIKDAAKNKDTSSDIPIIAVGAVLAAAIMAAPFIHQKWSKARS